MHPFDPSIEQPSQIEAVLTTGIEQVGLRRPLLFQAYTRVVLPIDGYVFWSPTVQVIAEGVLHFGQQFVQTEVESYGRAQIRFTAQKGIAEFDSLGNNTLFVARVGGVRFAFSSHGAFQDAAGQWHYEGDSISPVLAAQLLDPPRTIDPSQPVVSNSLPLWLELNNYSNGLSDWLSNTGANAIPVFPSSLVTPNLPPPYVSIHIGRDDTRALQAMPYLDKTRSSWQLVADRVRVTMVGLQNDTAIDFENLILQYIVFTENMGLMSMVVVRDDKRPQAEVQAIAMQKVIELEVSYTQARVAQVARNIISTATPITIIANTL